MDETTEQPEQTDEQDELAAMEAGFSSDAHSLSTFAPEREAPTEETEDEGEGSLESEEGPGEVEPDAPAPEPEPPAPSQEDVLAKRFAEQDKLSATLRQQLDTAFGKMGGLERTIRELREAAGRPTGIEGELSAEDFKDLAEEYPEVTQKLIAGLNQGLTRLLSKKAAPVEPAASQARYVTEESLSEWQAKHQSDVDTLVERRASVIVANAIMPGWKEIVGNDGDANPYRTWLAKQPDDYQQTIHDAWDPVVIKQSIDKFQKDTTPKPQPPAAKPGMKQRALFRAAVPARSSTHAEPAKVLSEEEAMMATFKE